MKKNYLLIAAAALALAGCQVLEQATPEKDITPEDVTPVQEVVESSMPEVIYATIEGRDADTKAGFDYDSGNKVYNHYWVDEVGKEDIIHVFYSGTDATYKCTDASAGEFTFVTSKSSAYSGVNYYAIYNPDYSGVGSVANDVTYDGRISSEFDSGLTLSQNPDGSYGYNNVMVSRSDTPNFIFKNAVAWLKLQLTGLQQVEGIYVDPNPISGDGSKPSTVGSFNVTFDAEDNPVLDTSGLEYAGGRNFYIASPYAQLGYEPTVFYLAMPPINYTKGMTVTVRFTDGTTNVISTTNEIDLSRNVVTPMAVKPSYSLSVTNLSIDGKANCYVVGSEGWYRFKRSKVGSSTILDHYSPTVEWETWNTFNETVTPGSIVSNVSCLGDDIYFYCPFTKMGNALISVKDSEGNIVWSWHIWVTDLDPENNYYTFPEDLSGVSGGFKLMKYNLGAISSGQTDIGDFGMYYQWGRKDPVLASYNPTLYPVSITHNINVSTSEKSYEYGVQHPKTFIMGSSDWLSSSDEALWGAAKTVNDPCPPGWKVPSDTPFRQILTNHYVSGAYYNHLPLSRDEDHVLSNAVIFAQGGRITANGLTYEMSISACYGSGVIYPRAQYWTSTSGVYIGFSMHPSENPSVDTTSKWSGLSIRCQKM